MNRPDGHELVLSHHELGFAFGQKHCRLVSSINLLARLCVSSDSNAPFFVHRTRSRSVHELSLRPINIVQGAIKSGDLFMKLHEYKTPLTSLSLCCIIGVLYF